jgi:hypothetical protein
MPVSARIDDPADMQISTPVSTIRGWCCADKREQLRGLHFEIGGAPVPYTPQHRPDVAVAFPGKSTAGFLVHLDLSYYMWAIQGNEAVLQLITARQEPIELRFRVSADAIRRCLAASAGL